VYSFIHTSKGFPGDFKTLSLAFNEYTITVAPRLSPIHTQFEYIEGPKRHITETE